MRRSIQIHKTTVLILLLLTGCYSCGYGWPFNTRPHTYAAALGDLDGDGDLDAYLANGKNEGVERDTVWFNDGKGNFSYPAWQTLEAEKQHVSLGDLDGDGDLDALIDAGAVWAAINDGKGKFTYLRPYLYANDSVAYSYYPALGDLDGDGDLDAVLGGCCGAIVTTGSGDPGSPLYSYNIVWLNDGNGHFQDTGQRLGIFGTGAVALGDLEGDGDLDIFDANSSSVGDGTNEPEERQPNIIWLNDGQGIFSDSGQRLGREESYSVALGDLDGDDDLDAFVGNRGADTVWLNDGAGRFTDSGQRLGQDDTRLVALGDMDGDGDMDVLSAGRGFAVIWLNQGEIQNGRAGFFKQSQRLSISIWYAFAMADVDGDGDQDIFAGLLDKNTIVWRNDGKGRFREER